MLVWCNGGTNYLYHTIYEREICVYITSGEKTKGSTILLLLLLLLYYPTIILIHSRCPPHSLVVRASGFETGFDLRPRHTKDMKTGEV